MANSIKEYKYEAAHGDNPVYTAPDYLEGRAATDIEVWLGDSHTMAQKLVQDQHYTIDGTQVTIDGYNMGLGEYIYIKRVSSPDVRLTDYEEGSLLTADTLDADANQIFYLTQEALDEASKTNFAAGSFYHAGETAPKRIVNDVEVDPPIGTLWYDTLSSPNVLKIYNGEWYAAAPVKTVNEYIAADSEVTNYNADLQYIHPNNYIADADVLLNGVQLKLATDLDHIDIGTPAPSNGDYWYDESDGRLYIKKIVGEDSVMIRSFNGGYSTQVTESEANVEALSTLFNSKYGVIDPKLDEVIALDLDTKRQDILDSEARSEGIHDDVEDLKDLTKKYATSDVTFVNEDGVYAESAKTHSEEAKAEADRAHEIANGTQETLQGWTAIDNETITTTSVTDPILYSTTNLTLKADDKVIVDSNLEIAGGLEITGSTNISTLGIFNPIAVGRAFVNSDGDMHEVWEGSSGVTVAYHSSGVVKISHPEFESDKMAVFAHFVPDTRSGTSSDSKPYAVKVQPQPDNSIRLQASRDGGTQQTSNYSIANGSIAVVIYKF